MTENKHNKTFEETIFEKVMPDSIKGKVKQVVGDLKFPKEVINYMMSQVDETKNAAIGIIAKEVRTFLEKTNLTDEIADALTKVSFEISTTIRFVSNEDGSTKKGLKLKIERETDKQNSKKEDS
jgi:hypothetical protein